MRGRSRVPRMTILIKELSWLWFFRILPSRFIKFLKP